MTKNEFGPAIDRLVKLVDNGELEASLSGPRFLHLVADKLEALIDAIPSREDFEFFADTSCEFEDTICEDEEIGPLCRSCQLREWAKGVLEKKYYKEMT